MLLEYADDDGEKMLMSNRQQGVRVYLRLKHVLEMFEWNAVIEI